jgi:GLPGLI family protein
LEKIKRMKYLPIAAGLLILSSVATAQMKQGTIAYERTSQMQMQFHAAGMEGMQQNIPQTRTDKFELVFANNQSIWRSAVTGDDDANTFSSDGGGMRINMVFAGSNDVVYHNFDNAQRVEKRELMDKNFLVADSIRPLKWKMTGESKIILNHNCMKATSTRISTSMRMNMDNGVMERKEVQDTSNIIAWFASDIPVSAGPGEYQGQLPGAILEMDLGNGRQTYKATSISEKADVTLIKEPAGKKKLTPDEFKKERDKMMEQMQQNMQGGGGGRRVIIN